MWVVAVSEGNCCFFSSHSLCCRAVSRLIAIVLASWCRLTLSCLCSRKSVPRWMSRGSCASADLLLPCAMYFYEGYHIWTVLTVQNSNLLKNSCRKTKQCYVRNTNSLFGYYYKFLHFDRKKVGKVSRSVDFDHRNK